MNPLLYFLAGLGALLMLMGRRIIIDEVGELRSGWNFALRFLPLADFAFLIRYWGIAPRGGLIALLGFSLILPLCGKMTWDAHRPTPTSGRRTVSLDLFDSHTLRAMANASFVAAEERIKVKDERIRTLNQRLAEWYAGMEVRRKSLDVNSPASIQQFNAEAASYQQFHLLVRNETKQLQQLKSDLQ